MKAVGGVIVLLLLLSPAGAHGATVEVTPGGTKGFFSYRAAAGEQNRLTLRYPSQDKDVLRVRDPGAVIEPGASCTPVDEHTADCHGIDTDGTRTRLPADGEILLGRGDDAFEGPGVRNFFRLTIDGGAGDDELRGTDSDETLDGGGGRDRLYGGAGINTLIDGDDPSSPDADVLAGSRAGLDRVDYAERTRRVTVNLSKPSVRAGQRGEGDRIRGVDHADGGDGPDRIVGSDRRERDWEGSSLRGNSGDDVLIGRDPQRQSDQLEGGDGNDRLIGGRGGDRLEGGDGIDIVRCGRGRDLAVGSQPGELMRDCRRLVFTLPEHWIDAWPHPRSVSRRALTFRAECPTDAGPDSILSPCPGTLSVRTRGGRLLARQAFEGRRGEFFVTARLTALGRRLVSRPRGVVGTVTIAMDGWPTVGWDVRLRRQRTPTRSTTKTSVSSGPITPPAPRFP